MNERAIFIAALEKDDPAERNDYLQLACEGNPALQERIERLLKLNGEPDSFLQLTDQGEATVAPECVTEGPGMCIGPYKLLQFLGEGGMGTVFLAEQTEPVRRTVALKIIKPGMDSSQVLARFEAERQALALMDHPNIARVLDAGTISESEPRTSVSGAPQPLALVRGSGRPYFVMELVKGIPITEFCDQNKLTTRQRLELFIPVCQAIQHAHMKGIIHRDVKPSNVLIALYDGKPVPKVIDFGVAKAMAEPLTQRTLFTQVGQIVGTFEYMSPEQATLNQLDIDTRSDIYSLGVLLYELLTGVTPLDKERLRTLALDQMLRTIREEEPIRPSVRLSSAAGALAVAAAYRGGDSQTLVSQLRGELDWIVMRCLEKERARRYDTANALARDVERYLKDEPVEACPPSAGYRLRKFARKNSKALTTLATFIVLLLLGVAGSTWQAVRATQAETAANTNAVEAQDKEQEANQERIEAQRQRDVARALAEKLQAALEQQRWTTFAAHMNLAQHAWEAGGIDRTRELLELQLPRPGESDLRRFEWYYLSRLCRSDLLTLKHTEGVRSVTYSPDGKRLATVTFGRPGEEGEVQVWDAQTGKALLCFKEAGRSGSITFSPDGKHLVTASGHGKVKVCDAETGKELVTIEEPPPPHMLFNFAYSPDGKRLATDWGDLIKVWDAKSGKELFSIRAKGIGSLIFSPDGKRLATTSNRDKTTTVWDAENGDQLFTFQGPTGIRGYSPDGKRLVGAAPRDNVVKVWDAESGKELLTLQGHTNGVYSVVYSQDGKRLASVSADGVVKVWDAQEGHELFTVRGHGAVVFGLSFSPDGKRLASASGDKTVKVWDAQTGQNPTSFKMGGRVTSVAISPDGKRLAATGPVLAPGKGPLPDGEVKVWDIQTGKELFSRKGGAASVSFSPNGKLLANAGLVMGPGKALRGEVKVWDAQTGKELPSLTGGGSSVAFSPDSKFLASAGPVFDGLQPLGSEVRVWNVQTGNELHALKGGGVIPGPQGDGVAGGPSVTFSPDGKRLASASGKEIKVWDAQTGKELLAFKADGVCVAFSPDGKHLASSGVGVKVWDAQTGKELLTLKGHTDAWVSRVVYSPDGKRLVSTSRDKTVKIWDAQTGLELFTLEGHGGLFNGVAFSPDGHRLAAGSADGTVKIWDATPLPEKP